MDHDLFEKVSTRMSEGLDNLEEGLRKKFAVEDAVRRARIREEVTDETVVKLWEGLRAARLAGAEKRQKARHSFAPWFPRFAWVGSGAVVALVALAFVLPLLFGPQVEEWKGWKDGGSSKGAAVASELKFLTEMDWTLKPDFKNRTVTLPLSDGTVLSGTLTNAPEWNIFNEKELRVYGLDVSGQTKNGIILRGTGKLEVRSSLFAKNKDRLYAKLAEVKSAKLFLSLQSINLPSQASLDVKKLLDKTRP